MDIRKLQRAIVDGLEDVKAQNIVVFNTEHLSPLFERVIIASGTSNRQTKALAASVRDSVKSRGMQVMRTEGEDNGEWVIVDCGAAVAHIMQPAIRDYYHLEEIWGEKSVHMKMSAESRPKPAPKLFEAGSDDGDEEEAGAAAPARKAAVKKVATRKAPAAKRTVSRMTGVKSTPRAPVKKASAKKAAGKKAPAKKAAAKKASAKKAAAKKSAAKQASHSGRR
jgi:ribosome-associated protein